MATPDPFATVPGTGVLTGARVAPALAASAPTVHHHVIAVDPTLLAFAERAGRRLRSDTRALVRLWLLRR